MKVIDLSMPIKSLETPMFPTYPQPLKTVFTTFESHGFESSVWILVEHTATHVDAPRHFVRGGKTIDEIAVDTFVGWATAIDVSDLPPRHIITRDELRSRIELLPFKIEKGWILLLRTGYSEKAGTSEWFDHPGLGEDACEYLIELGVKAIGVDAPSPDREPFPAHRMLLPRGIAIYENLCNLEKVVGKKFLFVALPLKLAGGTASPVRAVAIFLD